MSRAAPDHRRDAEEGAVGILAGVAMAAVMGAAALAVDLGRVQFERRALQAAVDAAALTAVRKPADAAALVGGVMAGQGYGGASRTVTVGAYVDDTAQAAAGRFTVAGMPGDAVRVEARAAVPLGLARAVLPRETIEVAATAVASHRPVAGFTIGSGLASIESGIANQVLSRQLGGTVSLSAAAYTGLLNSQVSAIRLLDSIATVQAGNYRSLLASQVGVGRSLGAAAGVLAPGASQTAGTSLNLLSQAGMAGGRSLAVGSLLNLGIHQARPVGELVADRSYAAASVNALDLVQSAAALGGPAGAFDLPNAISIPGLADVKARLLVIQPPQPSGIGMANATTATTAQVRLLLTVELLGVLKGVSLQVLVEAARATGTLTSVSCQGVASADTTMTVQATTGVARVQLGTVSPANFNNPAFVFGTLAPAQVLGGLVSVSAAPVQLGSGSAALTWTVAEINAHALRSVSSGRLAGSLVGSLAGSLKVTALGVTLIDLGLLKSTLQGVLGSLDPIVDQILGALGVRLGFAEIRPIGARCGVPSLVL